MSEERTPTGPGGTRLSSVNPPGVPPSWVDLDRVPERFTGTETVPRKAVVPKGPAVLQERPATEKEYDLLSLLPPDAPLTQLERQSITGGRARQALGSIPMIIVAIGVVFATGFGVIGLLSGQNMSESEAIEEAERRTADLHAEARKAPEPSVPAPVAEPQRPGVIDLACSTAPIRANPDGTYEMEVCVR